MRRGAKSDAATVATRQSVSRKSRAPATSADHGLARRLAEALEREAAISEILRVMSSSPGDVQPVLEAVAERAAHLCDAPYANVLIREGEMLRPSAAAPLPKGKR